jgi:hypothetical protein
MDRIEMRERPRPQIVTPPHRELLGQSFVCKLEAYRTGVSIDKLQMPKFMKEHVIEYESPDGQYGPFLPWSRPELFGRLTVPEGLCQAHARRQGAQGDLPASPIYIA